MAEKFEYTREWTNAEAFPLLGFTKSWENPEDYPTIELDETQVRKDMQSLHDETKNYINDKLIPAVLAEDATEAARAAAEAQREANETQRIENENARIAAEQARVDETSGIVAQANQAAQSWAVGGTGTREGEDTNNAKYWSDKAKEAAGGDYVPNSEKGTANGVATLGADALLAAAQRPKAGGLYRDDGKTTLEKSLAEISTTLQNKAPSGYGLGTYGRPLGANDDLNNITKNGWYCWSSNLPANAITSWSAMFVNVINDGHIVQTIYPFSMPGTRIIRVCTGSIWKPDEYENPPMILGVEYRTTERYLGKPVYAMAVDCGATPNATTKDVIIKSSGVEELVFASFKLSSSQMLPYTWNNHNVFFNTAVYSNGEFRVFITSIDDMSKTTVTGIVKYTKTTD